MIMEKNVFVCYMQGDDRYDTIYCSNHVLWHETLDIPAGICGALRRGQISDLI